MEYLKSDKQNNSIDLCKLIMTFAVVAIHTRPFVNCTNDIILKVYELAVGLAVPFFFLASGYLLAIKMDYPYGSKEDIFRVKRQLIKIVKMYLLWTFIYSPLAIYHFVSNEMSLLKSILLYIRGFLFVGEQYNSWPLWYLLSTIYALVVIMMILRLKKSSLSLIVSSIIFSAISIGCTILVNYEENLPIALNLLQRLIKYSILNGRIFKGMIYIPIRMLLAHKKIPRILNCGMFAAGGLGNYFINNSFVSGYFLIITSVALFGILESIKLKNGKIYLTLRNMGTVIYLIHMYVWTFYYKIIYGKKTYGLDSFAATALVSSIIAIIYLKIKRQRTVE